MTERELAVKILTDSFRASNHGRTTAEFRRVARLYPGAEKEARHAVYQERHHERAVRHAAAGDKRPITPEELAVAIVIGDKVSFPPVAAANRIIRDIRAVGLDAQITDRQAQVILDAGHTYRRQSGICMKPGCAKCKPDSDKCGTCGCDVCGDGIVGAICDCVDCDAGCSGCDAYERANRVKPEVRHG